MAQGCGFVVCGAACRRSALNAVLVVLNCGVSGAACRRSAERERKRALNTVLVVLKYGVSGP